MQKGEEPGDMINREKEIVTLEGKVKTEEELKKDLPERLS